MVLLRVTQDRLELVEDLLEAVILTPMKRLEVNLVEDQAPLQLDLLEEPTLILLEVLLVEPEAFHTTKVELRPHPLRSTSHLPSGITKFSITKLTVSGGRKT